jgi:hypothetical protein
VYLVSAPASPLLGLMMDKTGRNISWVLMAVAGSIGCHLLLAFTRNHPAPLSHFWYNLIHLSPAYFLP